MSDPSFSFNLWTEPWIRATDLGGAETVLSIGGCLAEAHTLAALSDPSPLVVGGTHRLLAAILQAIYAPRDLDELAALLRDGRFDPARLEQFAARHAERFDIFHPTAPFLQTGDVPLDGWKKPKRSTNLETKATKVESKSPGYLFPEIPTATNRIHYLHTNDHAHRLCASCCARGLVTIPAFAMSGGSGIRPSINTDPPVYIFPIGRSLFETLVCSIIAADFLPRTADPNRADRAAWTAEFTVQKGLEVSTVGYLESLTFPARRMRLFPRIGKTTCTNCGQATSVSVHSMLFEMGHWLTKGFGLWTDPFVAYRQPRGRSANNDTGPKPVRLEEGKALWREYSGLLLVEREGDLRPAVVQQVAKLVQREVLPDDQNLRFRCVGVRNPSGKATVYEWLDESLEAPPTLLTDPYAAELVDRALGWANAAHGIIESSFNSYFRPERDRGGLSEKLTRFKAVRARMSADYWGRLAPRFRGFIAELAGADDPDAVVVAWADEVVWTGRQCFDMAAEQVGERADALRARVEAQAACHRRLSAKRKEWFGDDK